MKHILRSSSHLLLRVILVCALSFMSITIISISPELMIPFLAIFYFIVMLYFFTFTMWHAGVQDINKVKLNTQKETLYKGFLSALIVVLPLCMFNIIPLFFDLSQSNIFYTIFGIIKVVFSMCCVFAITFITGGNAMTFAENEGEAVQPINAILSTEIYCIMMIIFVIGAGIGYIFGYKRIEIFPPLYKNIKKMFGIKE